MPRRLLIVRLMCVAVALLVLAACASIGRPEGGPKDVEPPVFMHSDPMPGSLNFTGDRINIFFNENVQIDDVTNKVVISPVQKAMPQISANGKRLTVNFRDSMIPDVTYTIDFSDAISDLNEKNPIDGFAFDFSTGSERDSMVISGMVFEARTLEPAQGMIVGVYSNLEDSALTTLPLERITKTNQYGQFVLRNLKPTTYRLIALNDLNRDYHWDRTEDIAFLDFDVVPTLEHIEVTDTLISAAGTDSIATRPGIRYLPNDLLLTWFNENYKAQYLVNNSRNDSTRVVLEFAAPSDTFPTLRLLNTPAEGATFDAISRMEHSAGRDTLTYWLTRPDVIACDTLLVEARYLRTDTASQLSWTTDTLKIINKEAAKFRKQLAKQAEKPDTLPKPPTFLSLNSSARGTQELNRPLHLIVNQPIDTIIADGIHLEMLSDTIWSEIAHAPLVRDSLNRQLIFTLHHPWDAGQRYRLSVDSAAMTGIYGIHNNRFSSEFTVKTLDEYANLIFNISGIPDAPIYVELLNSADKPVAVAEAVDGVAVFNFLDAGTYYARAFADTNGNSLWDTGSIADRRQPENVWYYPRRIDVKKNWDITQTWVLDETPLDMQKPLEIKKNKPKDQQLPAKTTESDELFDEMP